MGEFEKLGRDLDDALLQARQAEYLARNPPRTNALSDLAALSPSASADVRWRRALEASGALVRAAEAAREDIVTAAIASGAGLKPSARAAGVAHTTATRWRDARRAAGDGADND